MSSRGADADWELGTVSSCFDAAGMRGADADWELGTVSSCFDAAGLRGADTDWELGTVCSRKLLKLRLMTRKNGTTLSD